jgi:ribosomal protein S3
MFLERIFTIFLNLPSSDSSLSKSKIKGLKFILSGRIQAKLRSSKEIIQVGKVPSQSIEKNIEFSKIHVYTLFGAFGLKL